MTSIYLAMGIYLAIGVVMAAILYKQTIPPERWNVPVFAVTFGWLFLALARIYGWCREQSR